LMCEFSHLLGREGFSARSSGQKLNLNQREGRPGVNVGSSQ
jgi:hypothetical protein